MSFVNKKFKEVDFCQKKHWLNDPKMGCKSPFNLFKFMERDVDLEGELE